jgi:outer membrane protein
MKYSTALAAAAVSLVTLATVAPQAQAQEAGDWLVRARALHLDSANRDNTGLNLSVNNKTFPEVDISYFVTKQFAVELVLTYPQKHDLRSNGANIGSLKHLPPTLLAQWHFPMGQLRPYLGAGLNYTRFSAVKFSPAVQAALNPRIDKNSTGLALQVGADYDVGDGWFVNVDLKKVRLQTDVFAGATKAGTFKVDPVLFSFGIGKKF